MSEPRDVQRTLMAPFCDGPIDRQGLLQRQDPLGWRGRSGARRSASRSGWLRVWRGLRPDVDVTESKVDFDQVTRRLTLLGGNRKEAAADELIEPLLELLGEHPEGLSGRQIGENLKTDYPQHKIRAVLKRAKSLGLTVQTPGRNRAIIHRLAPGASSASEVRQRTGEECVSASLDNAHTLTPAEEQDPSASVTHSGPEVPEEEAPAPR